MTLEVRCTTSKLSRSEEHTSELQSRSDLVCRLLLEKKNRQLIPRRLPGRHFNLHFEAILIDAGAGQNRLKNPFHMFLREKRRRAAAWMHREHRPVGQRRN